MDSSNSEEQSNSHTESIYTRGVTLFTPNRVPGPKEENLIRDLIQSDLEEISIAESRTEKQSTTLKEIRDAIASIESRLPPAKAIQRLANNRLESSLAIEKTLALEVRTAAEPDHLESANVAMSASAYAMDITQLRSDIEMYIEKTQDSARYIEHLEADLLAHNSALVQALAARSITVTYIQELYKSIQIKRELISQGKSLPTELLLKIFEEVLTLEMNSARNSRYVAHNHGVYVISAVCRRWRSIVKSQPSLWAYVSLPKPSTNNSEDRIFLNHLRNARGNRMNILHWPLNIKSDDGLALLRSLSPEERDAYLEQCQTLKIIRQHSVGLLPSVLCEWAVAEYLLRNLKPQFTPIARATITKLSFHFTGDIRHNILRSCLDGLENLISLDLRINGQITALMTGIAPVVYPHLTEISTSRKIMNTLLSQVVTIPLLKRLTVKTVALRAKSTMELDAVVSTGLASRLNHLEFVGVSSSENTCNYFTPLLRLLTALETLELHGQFQEGIIAEITKNKIIPRLRRVILRRTDISSKLLEDFIHSRGTDDSQSIEELVLDHCPGITRSFCEEIGKNLKKLDVYS